jgi:hypothetical protein
MRKFLLSIVLMLAAAGVAVAASPEQEKAFTDAYQKAFDAKDAAGIQSLLYTKGADPVVLQFYGEMLTSEMADGKLVSIALQDLTPEDVAKACEVQDGPGGGKVKLAPKPYKKLVLKVETKTSDTTSSSTSEVFVADVDGKVLISVPIPAK